MDLKLSTSTNSSASALAASPSARQRAAEARRQLAAVGQLRERVVVRQVMQLARAFGDVPLELRLVRAQLGFGAGDLVRHGVEGFGQLVDLGEPPRGARAVAVAGGQLPRRGGQAANRQADADHQQHRDQQQHAEHRGAPVSSACARATSAA